MKYAKILIFVLLAAALLYLPVSMFFSTAQAAETLDAQEEILPLPQELNDPEGGLQRTSYTPENYIQPQYDPFTNTFRSSPEFEEKVRQRVDNLNTPPEALFNVRTPSGIADSRSGTTATEFTFDAHASRDNETRSSRLQVRWDFESDGEFDTYFSRTKTTRHTFEQPGLYEVTLEVLDRGGLIARASAQVTVVENTPPFAHFSFKPTSGTTARIFTFNTSESSDSQYKRQHLKYRFDWNGDGVWDTPFNQKTVWNHRFDEPGAYRVVMEAQDPEEASGFTEALLEVFENTLPSARFTVEVKPLKVRADEWRNKYYYDASGSFDPENSGKLQYRWDFNYTGSNDINFTTQWRSSPTYSGFYDFTGEKTVRLQVRDEDGAVSEAFATIVVE